ncbi:hypothetical protein CC2G_001607 [Coprinopsis cinerea AmutBmut pab1-1]|nr:hypothetical protein CC2G_001607 [Coprinopsis cinerea AmutBmut pab1-1]
MWGWISFEGRRLRWTFNRAQAPVGTSAEPLQALGDDEDRSALARQLILYPLIYIVCVSTTSLSRWFYFSGQEPPRPRQFSLWAYTIFSLSDLLTRPQLVLGAEIPIVEEDYSNRAQELSGFSIHRCLDSPW